MNKSEVVLNLLKRNYLVSPDFFEDLSDKDLNKLSANVFGDERPMVLDKDLLFLIKNNLKIDINWRDFEQSKVVFEKGKDKKIYKTFLDIFYYDVSEKKKKKIDTILETVKKPQPIEKVVVEREDDFPGVIVLDSYKEKNKKREVQDFVSYFRSRYDSIKKILQGRQELREVISINRALNKNVKENVVLIGLVYEKRFTKNGNVMLTLEDTTGHINIIINKNRDDLFTVAKDLVLDEVIGISGFISNNFVFANDLFLPDVPIDKELKKSSDDAYAVFTADLHVGSNMFFEEDFLNFVSWLNGEYGDKEHKEISSKIKYLFIVGDLIDGVGIYPNQDKELFIKDVYKQYEKCAELLKLIRKDITIIVCPGNHDALRLAEPQPIMDKEIAKPLWDLKNVMFITNPGVVSIHSSKDFVGFDVLLYHGFSFTYFVDNVEGIRLNGGNDRSDLIMQFLLQKRHLAPTHESSLYIPDVNEDPLVIKKVPDFFVTGHMHRTSALNYRNTSLIACGCWQGQTPFMEKKGITPDPSKISIVNLKTREIKILKFGK